MNPSNLLPAIVAAFTVCFGAQAQDLTGTMKTIAERGSIVVGHRDSAAPFSYYNDQKEAIGFSMDLCNRVVEDLKLAIKKPGLQVKYWPVNSQTRIPLLIGGTIDMECGTTTITLGRQAQVDFSPIIFATGTRLLTRVGSGVKDAQTLAGKRVTVVQGTTNERVLTAYIADKKIPNVRIVQTKDAAEALMTLETKRSDAVYTEEVVLEELRSKSRQKNDYEIVGPYLTSDTYGLMIRRNDPDFRLQLARTLASLYRTGEINKTYVKWFPDTPMSGLTKAVYQLGAIDE